jgi:(R,R)-butanediol dehydrogenase / meso-butanediol dehydrogenase / diacetyl reductase
VRAARYYGVGDVRIEDVPEPSPGPKEVLVRVLANGLCGTDLHQYFVGPLSDAPLPIIVGHEFAGEIVEVGEGVRSSRIGELVAVEPIWRCNACQPCHDGDYNLCQLGYWHGLTGMAGGLCELTVVRDEMAWTVPEGIAPMDAALVEPLSVAFHAVERAAVAAGDRAVVLGAGPIGIGTYLGLRAEGVEQVIVVEPAPERRAAAEAVGATEVIDPSGGGAAEQVMTMTAGAGASVVIDAAGTQASFGDALAVLSPKGRVILVAAFANPVEFNPMLVLQREARIDLSFAYRGSFAPVLAHMQAGRYPTEPWVSHVAFDELDDAYGRLQSREAVKLLVDI